TTVAGAAGNGCAPAPDNGAPGSGCAEAAGRGAPGCAARFASDSCCGQNMISAATQATSKAAPVAYARRVQVDVMRVAGPRATNASYVPLRSMDDVDKRALLAGALLGASHSSASALPSSRAD